MTTAPIPICESCARLHPGPEGLGLACAAFPDGIPDAIYIEGFDHRRPYPGDGGIRWKQDDTPGVDLRLSAFEASLSLR